MFQTINKAFAPITPAVLAPRQAPSHRAPGPNGNDRDTAPGADQLSAGVAVVGLVRNQVRGGGVPPTGCRSASPPCARRPWGEKLGLAVIFQRQDAKEYRGDITRSREGAKDDDFATEAQRPPRQFVLKDY